MIWIYDCIPYSTNPNHSRFSMMFLVKLLIALTLSTLSTASITIIEREVSIWFCFIFYIYSICFCKNYLSNDKTCKDTIFLLYFLLAFCCESKTFKNKIFGSGTISYSWIDELKNVFLLECFICEGVYLMRREMRGERWTSRRIGLKH